MKTRAVVMSVIVLAGLLGGCNSVSGGAGQELSGQVSSKQREMQALTRMGAEPADSPRSTYPGGTTAAEWKSISTSEPK
jgi:predicted small secreted protein